MTELIKILKCPLYPVTEDEARLKIKEIVDSKKSGYSIAINAEKLSKYNSDEPLRAIIDNAIYPYPDGAGAVIGAKWLYNKSSEKVNFPIITLEECNEYKWPLFIVGAKEETHFKAINLIKQRYPDINLIGSMHGYHDQDDIVAKIAELKPTVVMIAMGSPRQEYFAHKVTSKVENVFATGCGGALDIIAGNLKRAPEFFIHNNLEWLYRLVQEPWRWKRQLVLPVFLLKLIKEKALNKKKTLRRFFFVFLFFYLGIYA
jgi:N-acetylglucosaminyldiphosphoundecaprenol N-acetyl-beta-D-mannosaminyltransferase